MQSDRLPPPPAVPAEAREVAETWRPPAAHYPHPCGPGCPCGRPWERPRGFIPDDELDRIFGACESVDPGPQLEELGSLRADLRTIERVHGWYDDEPHDDSCGWEPL